MDYIGGDADRGACYVSGVDGSSGRLVVWLLVSFLRKQESRNYMGDYFVYILTSQRNGTLYTGVTNNLLKRVDEHKNNLISGFTSKYGVNQLVYFEKYSDIYDAITREKRIKKWKRAWKIELIEKSNPEWRDLYNDLAV